MSRTKKFSEDEFNQLKEKYINIINSNIKNQSYSKKKGVSLKINDKTYDTNAYILTISKEKFNDIKPLMYEVETALEEVYDADDLQELSIELSEFNYYHNTNK